MKPAPNNSNHSTPPAHSADAAVAHVVRTPRLRRNLLRPVCAGTARVLRVGRRTEQSRRAQHAVHARRRADLRGLLQLLFPGFHDDDAVHHGTLAELTRERISTVGIAAGRPGAQKRPHRRPEEADRPHAADSPAFFHSLAEVRELLRTDIEAAYEGDPAALYSEEIILSYPFIEAIAIQRLAHILYRRRRADHSAHDDGMGAQPHGH